MIIALDHVVLLCPTIADGQRLYEALLGRTADWQAVDPAGYASVYFQLDGIALELIAPQGDGPLADKLRLRLQQEGPGLQSIAFSSDALEADRKTLERRALKPTEISVGQSKDLASGRVRQWTRFRLQDDCAAGLRLFILQRSGEDPLVAKPAPVSSVIGLDHLVINTANPDRALVLFGARLALALALDFSSAERDIRLMSFKAGISAIELSHRPSAASLKAADKLWGITWRVNDIEAAHKRLVDAGVNVSDVRQGLRKATRVFTVRDGTLNVPTLALSNVNTPPEL
jgi:catechol 2,3-dioxygenase-like lactoylglutathione lyase family enzyme